MEQPRNWPTQLEPEELGYMYLGMQKQIPKQQPETEQCYAPPMPNPFRPSECSSLLSFGRSAASTILSFGANDQWQPSASNILSPFDDRTSTLNVAGAAWQTEGAMLQVLGKRSRPSGSAAQEHVAAERQRREKMKYQFVQLATIVPGLKKTDKMSVLGSTIDYVKQLEEKVKSMEEHRRRRTAESTDNRCRISANNDDIGPTGYSRPAVEASIRGDTVLVKICCKETRGVLVMVLSELENQGLSTINTSVVPFTDSCLDITITAKIEEGFSSVVELVKNLTMAFKDFFQQKEKTSIQITSSVHSF